MEETLEIKDKVYKLNGSLKKEEIPEKKERLVLKIIKAPFIHFMILGTILFFATSYIKERQDNKRYAIHITDKDLYRIAALWEKQYGSIPTQKELENLVNNFIREEVFYREGIEMGLDKEDEVIRRRIIQKLEFLHQDLAIVKEPTEEELSNYFEKNKSKYKVPEKLSFTHIFFSPDKGGDQRAIQRANQAKAILISQNVARKPELGDNFPFLYDYSEISETDLVHLLGESPLSSEIFTLPAHQWSGPLRSGYGYHLVYINNKKPVTILLLEEVKDKVKADYLEEARVQKNEEAFNKVKAKYSITKSDLHALK